MTSDEPSGEDAWQRLVLLRESTHLDFKSPRAFANDGRGQLAKHIIGMSNIEDGGRLIIGAEEDAATRKPVPVGLAAADLKTFDTTKVAAFVNKYVEPPVDLSVGTMEVAGKHLVVITVAEFTTTQTICTKAAPQDPSDPLKHLFHEGDVLIRTAAAETRRVRTAEEMRNLLKLALRKRSDELLHDVRRVLEGRRQDREPTANELHAAALAKWTQARPSPMPPGGVLELRFLPVPAITEQDQFKLRDAVKKSAVNLSLLEFPWLVHGETSIGNDEVEGKTLLDPLREHWLQHSSGAFFCERVIPEAHASKKREIYFKRTFYSAVIAVLFMKRLYRELMVNGALHYEFFLHDMNGRVLTFEEPAMWDHTSKLADIAVRGITSTVELDAGWEHVATEIGRRLFAPFDYEATEQWLLQLVERVKSNRW